MFCCWVFGGLVVGFFVGRVCTSHAKTHTHQQQQETNRKQTNKKQTAPTGHDRVAELLHALGERRAVGDDLALVADKLGRGGHLERDGERRDRVVVRAALQPREHGAVDGLLEVLAVEDHAAARAAQALVRRRRDDVAVRERRRRDAGGDLFLFFFVCLSV